MQPWSPFLACTDIEKTKSVLLALLRMSFLQMFMLFLRVPCISLVTFAGVKERDIGNVKTRLAKLHFCWTEFFAFSSSAAALLGGGEEAHEHASQWALPTGSEPLLALYPRASQTGDAPLGLGPPPAGHLLSPQPRTASSEVAADGSRHSLGRSASAPPAKGWPVPSLKICS